MNARLRLAPPPGRFIATYRISASDERQAMERARALCVEQTVEFPPELLPPGPARETVPGRVEGLWQKGNGEYDAVLSYDEESAAGELTQLLNILFGNSSLRMGIVLRSFQLSPRLASAFPGPRLGRRGLRRSLGVPRRPLLCTVLKPMGLSAAELAAQAESFALGGVDIVKDDHGLTDQPYAPFRQRVELCAAAVARVNAQTGRNCLYFANVTAPFHRVLERARFARDVGAGGLLLAPGLVGLDTMRHLAQDDSLGLPIMSHPAMLGSFMLSPRHGIAPHALLGQISRLAGADACIFPAHNGRLPFSRRTCRRVAWGTEVPMGHIDTIFPVAAGGVHLDRLEDIMQVMGPQVALLIGGDLHRDPRGLVEASRRFLGIVQGHVPRRHGSAEKRLSGS